MALASYYTMDSMNIISQHDYRRISKALEYLRLNARQHPSLDEVAQSVNLSPFHFQRLFTKWAGVSPKQFQQFLTLEYVKSRLSHVPPSLFDVAHEAGLSGTGRLHDLFVNIEGMTPGEFKQGGRTLDIYHNEYESPFGTLVVANTKRGICHIQFGDEGPQALRSAFPKATFYHGHHPMHDAVLDVLKGDGDFPDKISLHLKGTPFQLKVWQALLEIPEGQLSSYGELAEKVGSPNASRAVGSAIGRNPIAYIIPCHRVIRNSGEIGGYRWGVERKRCLIASEGVLISRDLKA